MTIHPMTYQGTTKEEWRLKKLPCFKAYVVWNIDKQCWFYPPVYEDSPDDHCVFMRGLWASEEMAEKDICIPNYAIVTIDMSHKIPADMKRLMGMGDTSVSELKGMILSKFRQLVKVFVFNNPDMIKQMKDIYAPVTQ